MAGTGKEIIPAGIKPPPDLDSEDETPLVFLQLINRKISFFHFPYDELASEASDVLASNKSGEIHVILRDPTGIMCYGTLTVEEGKFSSWILNGWTDYSGNWTSFKEQTQ